VTPVRRAVPGDLTNLLPLVAEFCAIDGHEHDADRVRTALGPLLGDDALGQVWVLDGPAGPGSESRASSGGWLTFGNESAPFLAHFPSPDSVSAEGAPSLRGVFLAGAPSFLQMESHGAGS
jgi:hypothetical protein